MPTFEETIDKATAWDGHTDNRTTHGIVCKAINSDGTTLLAHASGTTHPSTSSPAITPSNTFAIASCTKLLTSICALQCVERGLIGLDDPLDALLPELCAQPIITPNPNPRAETQFAYTPRSRPLTLRHLLTHTSGLAYAALHPTIGAWREANGGGGAGDVVSDCGAPLLHEPGAGWTYGVGVDWAGKLVERLNAPPAPPRPSPSPPSAAAAAAASGGGGAGGGAGGEGEPRTVTLEAYMTENIWTPLGLRDSTFLLARRPDIEARLVQTAEKRRNGGGGVLAPRAEGATAWPPRRPRDCLGGDGLYSSVEDYVAVLRDLMREQPTLLKRETADLLFAPQLPASGEARRDLKVAMDGMGAIWGGKVPEGVGLDYGLGGLLYVDGDLSTGMRRGTLTWAGNGNTLWFVNRGADGGKGVAAFFATQLLPSGGPEISRLVRLFVQEVWKRAE
ncbi:hypothetical protein SLS58_007330 [Diplodia intermedia]|uniref:Beta-lactamase-related domain-containing protein n=1 Tax=Diplodia intermedia TaxID=856260 RepID=A0ABR3TKH2_9PEZI